MPDFKIGCQTITWGATQKDRFPEVFTEIAAGGFDGVEIGFRHIQALAPKELRAMLDSRGLAFAATHIGGNLADADQAGGERGLLGEALDYLEGIGADILMYSGLRYHDDDQLARDMETLNRAAEKCAKRGVRLLYHNHNWEFAHDGKAINALVNNGCKNLGFCPDVGWVMKGGREIGGFLDSIKTRIGLVHFKDFATNENKTDTVLLGDGVAPLEEAAAWMKKNTPGLWAIAEQDRADVPTAQVAKSNAAYLKRVFG